MVTAADQFKLASDFESLPIPARVNTQFHCFLDFCANAEKVAKVARGESSNKNEVVFSVEFRHSVPKIGRLALGSSADVITQNSKNQWAQI
jgi:hypothetical protein